MSYGLPLTFEDKIAAAAARSDRNKPVEYYEDGVLKGQRIEPWHLDCGNCQDGAGGNGILDDEHNCVGGAACHTKAADNQDYGARLAAKIKAAVLQAS